MSQSPEYPDLTWMPPRSWTDANRTSVQLIVIHATDGSEHSRSAEDGAAYDQRRTDGTSTHYFHDQDSTVQCVRTEDIAHAARNQGNLRGIQHELCGKAGQGAVGWADAGSQAELRQAAKQCARDAAKWSIPVRRLTPAQVAAGQRGFCGHVDVTAAFPADRGTHTDPGPDFPWSQFLDMVRAEMEDDVALTLSDDEVKRIARAVWAADVIPVVGTTWTAGGTLGVIYEQMPDRVKAALAPQLAALPGALRDELGAHDGPDAIAVEAAVARALARLQLAAVPPAA